MNKNHFIIVVCMMLMAAIEGVLGAFAIMRGVISRKEFSLLILLISAVQTLIFLGFMMAFRGKKNKKV